MASSAIRKAVWMSDHFDEQMLISEDMEWSYRIKKKGHKVLYARDSIVEHYHNYTINELYHRHIKEGVDSVKIFSINDSTMGMFMKVFLYPLVHAIIRDTPHLMKIFGWKYIFTMPVYRLVLFWGRFIGTIKALKQKNRVYK